MDVFVELASSLLSFAHQVFGPGLCPGDWVWATSTAGALIALLPITGAFLVALIRKGTGNLYNGTTIGVFGTIGLLTVFLVPLFLMLGISETFRQAFVGGGEGLLSSAELGSLNTTLCSFIGDQRVYLGGGENVFETLFYPGGDKLAYGFYLGALGGLPVLSLVFVMLQARLAFRKGPRWPARLFWVPFVLLVACTAGVSANTAVHLWLGFLPVSVLGLVPVAMLGPPSWKALRRSERPREEARPAVPATPPPPTPATSATAGQGVPADGSRARATRGAGAGRRCRVGADATGLGLGVFRQPVQADQAAGPRRVRHRLGGGGHSAGPHGRVEDRACSERRGRGTHAA